MENTDFLSLFIFDAGIWLNEEVCVRKTKDTVGG